jgi:hypothetical protein
MSLLARVFRRSLEFFNWRRSTTVDPYQATNPATHNEVRFAASIVGKLHAGLNKTSLSRGTMPAIAF